MTISTFEYVKDALKYKGKGNFALAETALKRALTLDPGNISTLNELALLKMDMKLYEEALEILDEILDSKKITLSIYRRAICLHKLNRPVDAIRALTNLELMQYDFTGAWELRCDINIESKDYKEALSCINEEIRHNPSNLKLYYKRANVYTLLNKPDLALSDYKKIALDDYKNLDSYVPYVELLVERGDYTTANTYLKQSFMYGEHERLKELSDIVTEKLGLTI